MRDKSRDGSCSPEVKCSNSSSRQEKTNTLIGKLTIQSIIPWGVFKPAIKGWWWIAGSCSGTDSSSLCSHGSHTAHEHNVLLLLPRTPEPPHWQRQPTKLPCPTPSFPKQLPAGLGIAKNAAFSCFLPFFFFFVFFPTSFLSLFLFWHFPPLTRFVRSWVGSLLISIHSSFWISDSDPTFASPKILILLPKMTHIYSNGAL